MRIKPFLGLALCASLILPSGGGAESLGEKISKKVTPIIEYSETDPTYGEAEKIKVTSKTVTEDLGRSFNLVSYDSSILDNPFREIPDSDRQPLFENFFNQLEKVLQTDYGYYALTPEMANAPGYDDWLERMNHDDDYGVDSKRAIYKAGKEVLQGYDFVKKVRKKVRNATSVRVKVEETEFRAGAKFSTRSLVKPYVGINNVTGRGKDRLEFSVDVGGEYSLEYRIKIGQNKYLGVEFEKGEKGDTISTAFRWKF